MKKLVPHKDQEDAIAFILENERVLLKAPVGAGKTLVAVESFLRSDAVTCLVVLPLNTVTGWKRTVERQSQGSVPFRHITSKKDGIDAYNALTEGVPGVYVIGWEFMRTMSWKSVPVDFLVADECHRGTNRKSKAHTMLSTLKARYHVEMSGTPAGNNVEGLWAIGRRLWPQQTIRGFWNWTTEYLKTEVEHLNIRGEQRAFKKFKGEREPGRILAEMPAAYKMPSIYSEKPVIHEVEVELNPTQRKHYKELELEAVTFLAENPLVVEIPAVKYMRLMEMTLAVPSIKQDWIRVYNPETEEWEQEWGDVVYFEDNAKSSKADAVIEILSDLQVERPEPVMVYTHSRKFATFLTKRLQSKGFEARQFVGGMSQDERDWKISEFGKEFSVMVATISAIGEGVDSLQYVCHNEIWCSVSDSRLLNFQAAGRINRQGQESTVQRYVIRATDTIEIVQKGRLHADQQLLNASMGEELEVI